MTDQNLEEAINTLAAGSAICFLGAGFGTDAKDAFGKAVPSSEQFAEEICQLIGISRAEGGSLSDLADYCQSDSELAPKLTALMINRLTHCVPSAPQLKILNAPWRSIFTSNFDDIAERALSQRALQIITPTSDVKLIVADKMPIYYVHGRALDILENKGDPRIVLSETNYLELEHRNVDLHAVFINELHCAHKVFFIGYSLRDMDIARSLFSLNEILGSKSIVICGPSEGLIAQSRLRKFGAVHAIGLKGFSNELPDDFEQTKVAGSIDRLAFVRPTIREPASDCVTREDVDRLILTGEFDYSKCATQQSSGDDQDLYCVRRDERLAEIFDSVQKHVNRFVVSSDIGNGKTIFLDQLNYAAHRRGYDVFIINSRLPEVFMDLEFLLSRKTLQMFLIDDVVRNLDAAKFIGARLSGLSTLVCSTRDAIDEQRYGELLTILGGASREVDLNILSSSELKEWDSLLERWGLWEKRISLGERARFNFLKNDCASETRSIVVSIFETSRIAEKIRAIVSYFLTSKPQHITAFVAILICSLCQKHVDWGRVVEWFRIDQHSLRRDMQGQPVFNFMSGRRDWYQFTSSQLANYIFNHFDFDENILVEVYTKIVKETAYSANDRRSGFNSSENLKELMRYRFLTHIFGEGERALTSIEAIYKRLSANPRIRKNDQFWLQYAMSCMEVKNISDAQTYINTALGIAEKKGADYSNHQILDQRVRLLLLKNAERNGKPDENEIDTALTDLETRIKRGERDKIYALRSAEFILRFIDEKIEFMGVPLRERMLKTLDDMDRMVTTGKLEKSKKGETEKLKKVIRDATLVLKNA